MDCTKDGFMKVVEGPSSGILLWTLLRIVLNKLVGVAIFRYNAVYRTEDCFIQVGGGGQSSGILRWTVPKTTLYRSVGGEIFKKNAVDCTEDCF